MWTLRTRRTEKTVRLTSQIQISNTETPSHRNSSFCRNNISRDQRVVRPLSTILKWSPLLGPGARPCKWRWSLEMIPLPHLPVVRQTFPSVTPTPDIHLIFSQLCSSRKKPPDVFSTTVPSAYFSLLMNVIATGIFLPRLWIQIASSCSLRSLWKGEIMRKCPKNHF